MKVSKIGLRLYGGPEVFTQKIREIIWKREQQTMRECLTRFSSLVIVSSGEMNNLNEKAVFRILYWIQKE